MVKALWLAALLFVQGATPAQNSVFKVSGVVVREDNQDPARASNGDRVLLRGNGGTSIIDVGAGGAFEFANVRPGAYQIVVGPNVTMDPINIVIADKDVAGLRVVVPDVVAVRGAVTVEGGGPLPRFQLAFARVDGPSVAPINFTVAGTFTAQMHSGQYRVTSSGLPLGYSVKSMVVGAVDLVTQPLKVATGDLESITITLGVSSPPPWVKLSGRITSASSVTPVAGLRMSGAAGDVVT